MANDNVGAILEEGLSDWQIVQRDAEGRGALSLRGRWVAPSPGKVEVRLVHEETSAPPVPALEWQVAETAADGTWQATVAGVPAGGLYRVETRLRPPEQAAGEWSTRGDMRHFVGVGDLWVIAGQSNSAGYGRGPVHDPPEMGIHLFRNSEEWALATHPLNESTDTKHPVNREGGNSAHSPYLHFARVLKRATGCPVGLVQTSLGGSPLTAWNPTGPGDAPLFDNMVHCVRRAGGRVRGILWYQGESETGADEATASYAERFSAAVAAWREALDDPGLLVVTVQLSRYYVLGDEGHHRRWTRLREEQRQAARRLPGVAVVPTLDLPLSDGIHVGTAGNLVLGERMAHAALGLMALAPDYTQAPEIESARAGGASDEVLLTFRRVTSRIESIFPAAQPFRVEDAAGEVPVAQVAYTGGAGIRLVLERPLDGNACVHGPWGSNPEVAPMDMERAQPILGFYGVPVE